MQPFVQGLNFPTSIAVGREGEIYVAESGLPFGGAPPGGTVLRIDRGGGVERLLEGLRAPVNGLLRLGDALIVSEGGNPGRISRFHLDTGKMETLLDGLPGFGNYHTNMAVPGPDGKLYFSQGAMTNSGIIGLDSGDMAWLRAISHRCDIPGYDVTLAGVNADTPDPRSGSGGAARTGSFSPFGVPVSAGQRIAGRTPCTSAVMRCDPDGSHLELVAWGLRNAYGLGFLPDGRLLATDQGADRRGSRPLSNCPDYLYEVHAGRWYGWPDFSGGVPVNDARFHTPGGPEIQFLLANHAELPAPEKPLLEFGQNCSAVKFAVVPPACPRYAGNLIVALFGDERPLTAPDGPPAGRKLVRVSVEDWSLHPVQPLPLHRPIDVAFTKDAGSAYIVDFGAFEMTPELGVAARAATGAVWKVPVDFMEV